jgi:ABC-type molybdate transport system substrate-binding protein
VFAKKMTKKIFALVMVISVIGGVLAGCSQPAAEEKDKGTTAATATGTTAGTEEKKTTGE